MSRLLISLLPARIRNIIVMLGYPADRAEALEIVYRAGGWGRASTLHPDKDRRAYEVTPPAVSSEDEGMRRTLCDMALLIFHLVLSTWTFDGVDVPMAARIVTWNLHRYPSGVFPLLGAGRLALMRSRPDEAIEHYTRAMEVQTQYRNLHHVSLWEIAIAHLALGDPARSLGYWRQLEEEATWSKAIYTYGMAVCLLASSEGEESARFEEAKRLMEKVPTLRQKIAGKSIPVEKFVARKARKFISQNRLALPALEISYTFAAIAHAPRRVLETRMLPEVHKVVAYLTANPGSTGYWDDYCLARFLEGVCLRFVAFPDPDALLDPADSASATISRDDASAGSKAAFEAVFEHGPKIELDHHLVYYAHYEYGRLMACLDDEAEAKKQFELVLSGNHLEVGPSGRKGRYSLANALQMRTNAALDALHQKRL
ncbi:hypothetical protein MKEN_00557200 [Mycena kentingensis (nom. inval.)]|nr:hypothetical protein MKEN_00557200 [Mycena kentingensis (nom. inval.)]